MARQSPVLLLLAFIHVCFGSIPSICLFNQLTGTILKPVQLFPSDCPKNNSYCMNEVYNYGNYQYNGVSTLRPKEGEVVSFLTQMQTTGALNMVVMLNADTDITSKVHVNITGAAPANILLKDDPTGDSWTWNNITNTGAFAWETKPGFTDGVVIGNIVFVDNYCVSASFNQTVGAITTVSLLTGNTSSTTRVVSIPYDVGSSFVSCQYPLTASYYQNISCPGKRDGSASITIVFGPAQLSYAWYNSSNVLVASTQNATNLPADTYTVYITDPQSQGCNAVRTVTIYGPTLNGPVVTTTPFACTTKGSASATPSGGSGTFTYQWLSGATVIGTQSTISGLNIGTYSVKITDSCGSTATTVFNISSSGCCGDGICQANEACGTAGSCPADCGTCCAPGTYVSGTTCVVCPPGSWNNISQATDCNSCPANTYNAGGSDPCTPCPVNYVSDVGSGKCLRCPAGQVRSATDSSCSSCGEGTYAPPCDSSQCTGCPAGTITSTGGATICTQCLAGTYADTASSCTPCAINTYSSAGASSCEPCPTGLETVSAGATHVLACN